MERISFPANDLAEFAALFGGEASMRAGFPRTYAAYRASLAAAADGAAEEEPEYCEIEIVHVGYRDAGKKELVVDVQSYASDERGYCVLGARAVTGSGKELAAKAAGEFIRDVQTVSLVIPVNGRRLEDIEVQPLLYKVDGTVRRLRAEGGWLGNLSGYAVDYTCEITVTAPILKHTKKENTNINVAYLYPWHFPENIRDYCYDSEQMSDGNFRLPSSGSVEVSGLDLTSVTKCELQAVNAAGTRMFHATPRAVYKSRQRIEWSLDDNWGFQYRTFLNMLEELVTYTLSIHAAAGGQICTFTVTNNTAAIAASNRKLIPPILIYKDCLLAGGKVRMADGTERSAEAVRAGDRVDCGGAAAVVRGVSRSRAPDTVAHIQTEDGLELYVTCSHPVETAEGLRCAAFLTPGTRLKTVRGESRVKQVCALPMSDCDLVSIALEGARRLYVNGILAGDADAELTETERAFDLRYRVPEAWRRDYDGWKEMT